MLKSTLLSCPFRLKKGLSLIYSKAKQTPLTTFKRFLQMDIKILPALEDNYMYLIINKDTREAAVVDPVNPSQVLCAVKENNCALTKVLTTHHHWDHAGGNESLYCSVPNLEVYGGDDRIGALTCKVGHGTVICIGDIKIECLHTPCHTRGHICYYVQSSCNSAVFTGDTLFSGGCGKFFEGTAEQMYKALNEILSSLPDATQVYCGHEYTVNNLKFGIHVEPNNSEMQARLEWACNQRCLNCPTLPSTIEVEKLINPFMRVCEPAVKAHTQKCDPVEIMSCLRYEKDRFKC